MKHWFDEAFYRRTAAQLAALHPRFDPKRFLAVALDDLESLELMARMHRAAEAFHAALPLPFAEQAMFSAPMPRISVTASPVSGPAPMSQNRDSANPRSPCRRCAI